MSKRDVEAEVELVGRQLGAYAWSFKERIIRLCFHDEPNHACVFRPDEVLWRALVDLAERAQPPRPPAEVPAGYKRVRLAYYYGDEMGPTEPKEWSENVDFPAAIITADVPLPKPAEVVGTLE